MYVTDSHLPPSQVDDRCQKELMKIEKDPLQIQQLQAEAKQMQASVLLQT
jgi:hypothetical protein